MCALTSELVRKISTALFLLSMLCAAICRRKASSALQYGCHSSRARKPAGNSKISDTWKIYLVNSTSKSNPFYFSDVLTKLFHNFCRCIHLSLCRKRRKLEEKKKHYIISLIDSSPQASCLSFIPITVSH